MTLRGGQPLAWIAAALLFVIGGCVRVPVTRETYVGVIDRVEEREGDHYSPTKGRKPLNCVYLRLAKGPDTDEGELLHVLVLDLYSPVIYGQKGDEVSFERLGRLPATGEVWFDELFNYSILPIPPPKPARGLFLLRLIRSKGENPATTKRQLIERHSCNCQTAGAWESEPLEPAGIGHPIG